MTQAAFQAAIESDEELQRRFIEDPKAVLAEYAVDNELSEEELDAVAGGVALSESAFVHSVLTTIFKPGT